MQELFMCNFMEISILVRICEYANKNSQQYVCANDNPARYSLDFLTNPRGWVF